MADSFERLPFKEANRYLANKIRLPTAGWTDIWQEQHSHAFVIAGANKDALLEDMFNAIVQARDSGMGYPDFRKSFDEIVTKHGWAHNGGAGWRSKVIYDTNIRQAYNAGRWQQIMASGNEYLMYRHTSHEHPRLQHLAWNNLVLPVDDPWWNTHYPQNGWGCRCRVYSMSASEAKREWARQGKTKPDVAPEIKYVEVTVGKRSANPRTVRVPEGIDPGFAYNPGKAWLEPHSIPPLGGYDKVLKNRGRVWPGVVSSKPDLPKANRIGKSALLPVDTPPEHAVAEFLDVFGASLDKGSVFIDKVGNALAITAAMFQDGSGNFKWMRDIKKAGRLEYIYLLAMTLTDPDEIWMGWVEDGKEHGKWRLKRRYLRSFVLEDTGEFGITVFEWGRDGWIGATTFMANQKNAQPRLEYFDRQRIGDLIYKK